MKYLPLIKCWRHPDDFSKEDSEEYHNEYGMEYGFDPATASTVKPTKSSPAAATNTNQSLVTAEAVTQNSGMVSESSNILWASLVMNTKID